MPQFHTRTEPSLLPIECPRCPKCQSGHMMLARITPGPGGSDLRTFECPKCNHTHRTLAEDPMKLVSSEQNCSPQIDRLSTGSELKAASVGSLYQAARLARALAPIDRHT